MVNGWEVFLTSINASFDPKVGEDNDRSHQSNRGGAQMTAQANKPLFVNSSTDCTSTASIHVDLLEFISL